MGGPPVTPVPLALEDRRPAPLLSLCDWCDAEGVAVAEMDEELRRYVEDDGRPEVCIECERDLWQSMAEHYAKRVGHR